jgi:hypothetical protein
MTSGLVWHELNSVNSIDFMHFTGGPALHPTLDGHGEREGAGAFRALGGEIAPRGELPKPTWYIISMEIHHNTDDDAVAAIDNRERDHRPPSRPTR